MTVPNLNDILNGTFVGQLPDSDENWQLVVTHTGVVIAVNPNHPPHAVIDGKLVKLETPLNGQQELI